MKDLKDWTDVVRKSVREGHIEPSAGLWARIEGNMPAPSPQPLARRRPLRYVIPAAAMILVGLVITTLIFVDPQAEVKMADAIPVVAQPQTPAVQEDNAEPTLSVAPKIKTPKPKLIAQHIEPKVNETPAAVEPQPEPEEEQSSMVIVTPNRQSSEQTERAKPSQKPTGDINGWDIEPRKAPRHRGISAGLHIAGAPSQGSGATINRVMMSEMLLSPDDRGYVSAQRKEEDYIYKHRQPLSFGLSVSKEFAHGLSVGTGVNYSLLRSSVTLRTESRALDQTLQFVGIPININWAFLRSERFRVYIGAEGQAEMCVKAKFDDKTVKENGVQWSIHGLAGAQYMITNHFGVYVEPKVSHYFTDTNLSTIRTDKGAYFNLQLGFRLSY